MTNQHIAGGSKANTRRSRGASLAAVMVGLLVPGAAALAAPSSASTISSTTQVQAVPAFVLDQQATTKTAEAK